MTLPSPANLPRAVKTTVVFDTYWRFAAERQNIFFGRIRSSTGPWTRDPILARYKFTNAFRACDRVSQYLIKNVIAQGELDSKEVFFRILLFKIFNKIETWELLVHELGQLRWADFSFPAYDGALTRAMERGTKVYSAAYIMPAGGITDRKHRHHLRLLERMMNDEVPSRLSDCSRMEQAFELLRSYSSVGDFLAYQFLIDLNYSELLQFDENEFVKAGPGARDGIRKCFSNWGECSAEDLIRYMTETQSEQFRRLGIEFRNLWGRRLQLIDCQNLFCEVDKYARQAHPEIIGESGRTRIKQEFRPNLRQIDYFFPPKWGINKDLPS